MAADDLKTMLTTVLNNKGKKRFFFAYGTGKRSDGNGDGHLIVAKKKPKKPDVQAACACSSFVEGYCWSGEVEKTVFFSGKTKLAVPIVAKMALTAKKLAGKQFDFQVPSEAEEKRGASLQEGEGEESEQQQDGAPVNEQVPPPPPPGSTNEGVIPPAPPAPLAATPLANRLKGLLPEVMKASTAKSPATAALKELVAKSKAIIDKKLVPQEEFTEAEGFLNQIDNLLKSPNGVQEQEQVETEGQQENEADIYRKRVQELTPAYNTAKKEGTRPDLKQLEAGWTKATQLGDQEQYFQALKLLDVLAPKLAPAPSTIPPAPPPPDIPKAPPMPESSAPLAARMKLLVPEVMKAATAKSPATATLKDLLAKAKAIIDKKQLTQDQYGTVEDHLDDIELLLKQPNATPKTSAEPKSENEQSADFVKRVREVKALFAEAGKKLQPDQLVEMQKLVNQIDALAQKSDFPAALGVCDELETACRKAIRSAEVAQESSGGEGPKRVLFAKSRDTYLGARTLAQTELARLVSSIISDPDTQEDNRMAEIKAEAAKLPQQLSALDDRLVAALDTAFKASTANDRIAEAKKAREVVVGYQREIEGNQLLKQMDKDSGYGTFTIYNKLAASLQKLADTLNV